MHLLYNKTVEINIFQFSESKTAPANLLSIYKAYEW